MDTQIWNRESFSIIFRKRSDNFDLKPVIKPVIIYDLLIAYLLVLEWRLSCLIRSSSLPQASGLVTLMRLKEQNPTSTTDLNNNCVKTDDHLAKQQVHLQLKRSSTENGLSHGSLDSIELKEFSNNVTNHLRTSPLVSPSSPHSRQPSPSQLSINNHHNHQRCNGVCVITSEPKASCKPPNPHRHLATSHSNGTVAPQKIQIQINGNAIFSPSLKSPNALNPPHSPLVPSSYLSNSSKYTGYSTYGKLTHGAEHLPNTSSLCIDNLHSKTKIYNFKVGLRWLRWIAI